MHSTLRKKNDTKNKVQSLSFCTITFETERDTWSFSYFITIKFHVHVRIRYIFICLIISILRPLYIYDNDENVVKIKGRKCSRVYHNECLISQILQINFTNHIRYHVSSFFT